MTEAPYFEVVHRGSWWRARGDQPLLYRRRVRSLARLCPGGLLVDVGSGEGFFARRALARWSVVALERRMDGASRTRARSPRVVLGDGAHLCFRDRSIGCVTLWDVLEHVPRPSDVVHEVARSMLDGGILMISTPNPEALSVRRRGRDSTQFRDLTHVSVQPEASWRALLEECGFEVLSSGTDGWWDPPYFKGVPSLFWTVLAQVMFATRLHWPIKSGENLVIVSQRRARI